MNNPKKKNIFLSLTNNKIIYNIEVNIVSPNNIIEITCLDTIVNAVRNKTLLITPPSGLSAIVLEKTPNFKSKI